MKLLNYDRRFMSIFFSDSVPCRKSAIQQPRFRDNVERDLKIAPLDSEMPLLLPPDGPLLYENSKSNPEKPIQ